MRVLRRTAAVLIWPALAWLGAACNPTDSPTEPEKASDLLVAIAATLLVDDDKVQCPTAPFTTIQDAVNAANPGDVITVCAGLYPELAPGPLTINKSLTLVGPQSNVDARTRSGPEAVITDVQGTSVSASNVTIDGFTVQNSTAPAFTGYGIWINPGVSGTVIADNIIQDNIVGIGLANGTGNQAIIRHNWIRNNNAPGGATGSGIYTDQFAGGLVVTNVQIDENRFSGHGDGGAAINLSNTAAAGGVFDLEVTSNQFDANNRAFVLFNTHSSTFDGNTITGMTFAASADIRLFDNNSDLTFTNNDLSNGTGHAVRFSVIGAVGGPSSGVVFHQNNFAFYGLTGMTVDPGSHVGTVNAECNWWNSPSGPTAADNPGGTGEEVVGDADYRPWLTSPAPGGACVGGLPSGKVTGGGQIDVSGGKGNFGFNARQDNGVASGHLSYLNHATRAQLNCRVTLITELTATTAKFEGNCDSKSSSSSFKAEVEDNGEPGKGRDRFKIMYNGITDGGGPIRAGNIQIHR